MAQTSLITITNGYVGFADVPTGGADFDLTGVTGYCHQVSSAGIVASANTTSTPATFCSPASERSTSSSFSLEIEGLQDWGRDDGEQSFSEYLFTEDGGQVMAVLMPVSGNAINLGAVCEVSVAAGDFLGGSGDSLSFTGSMPLTGYPDIYDKDGNILRRGQSGSTTAQWNVIGEVTWSGFGAQTNA